MSREWSVPKWRLFRIVPLVAALTIVLGLWPLQAARAAPNACAASPAGLPNVIERTDFCVYYDASVVTLVQANTVADHVQNYWNRYVTDFGFRVPLHSGKLEVEILNNAGCNGSTTSANNEMNMWSGCFGTPESAQKVPGHELFHRVQFAYDTNFAANWWMTEGTARGIEDLAFTNIDHWPGALHRAFSASTSRSTPISPTPMWTSPASPNAIIRRSGGNTSPSNLEL